MTMPQPSVSPPPALARMLDEAIAHTTGFAVVHILAAPIADDSALVTEFLVKRKAGEFPEEFVARAAGYVRAGDDQDWHFEAFTPTLLRVRRRIGPRA